MPSFLGGKSGTAKQKDSLERKSSLSRPQGPDHFQKSQTIVLMAWSFFIAVRTPLLENRVNYNEL